MQDCQLVGKRVEQDANRTGSHRVRTPSKALGGLYLKGWAVNQLSLFNISVTHTCGNKETGPWQKLAQNFSCHPVPLTLKNLYLVVLYCRHLMFPLPVSGDCMFLEPAAGLLSSTDQNELWKDRETRFGTMDWGSPPVPRRLVLFCLPKKMGLRLCQSP